MLNEFKFYTNIVEFLMFIMTRGMLFERCYNIDDERKKEILIL